MGFSFKTTFLVVLSGWMVAGQGGLGVTTQAANPDEVSAKFILELKNLKENLQENWQSDLSQFAAIEMSAIPQPNEFRSEIINLISMKLKMIDGIRILPGMSTDAQMDQLWIMLSILNSIFIYGTYFDIISSENYFQAREPMQAGFTILFNYLVENFATFVKMNYINHPRFPELVQAMAYYSTLDMDVAASLESVLLVTNHESEKVRREAFLTDIGYFLSSGDHGESFLPSLQDIVNVTSVFDGTTTAESLVSLGYNFTAKMSYYIAELMSASFVNPNYRDLRTGLLKHVQEDFYAKVDADMKRVINAAKTLTVLVRWADLNQWSHCLEFSHKYMPFLIERLGVFAFWARNLAAVEDPNVPHRTDVKTYVQKWIDSALLIQRYFADIVTLTYYRYSDPSGKTPYDDRIGAKDYDLPINTISTINTARMKTYSASLLMYGLEIGQRSQDLMKYYGNDSLPHYLYCFYSMVQAVSLSLRNMNRGMPGILESQRISAVVVSVYRFFAESMSQIHSPANQIPNIYSVERRDPRYWPICSGLRLVVADTVISANEHFSLYSFCNFLAPHPTDKVAEKLDFVYTAQRPMSSVEAQSGNFALAPLPALLQSYPTAFPPELRKLIDPFLETTPPAAAHWQPLPQDTKGLLESVKMITLYSRLPYLHSGPDWQLQFLVADGNDPGYLNIIQNVLIYTSLLKKDFDEVTQSGLSSNSGQYAKLLYAMFPYLALSVLHMMYSINRNITQIGYFTHDPQSTDKLVILQSLLDTYNGMWKTMLAQFQQIATPDLIAQFKGQKYTYPNWNLEPYLEVTKPLDSQLWKDLVAELQNPAEHTAYTQFIDSSGLHANPSTANQPNKPPAGQSNSHNTP